MEEQPPAELFLNLIRQMMSSLHDQIAANREHALEAEHNADAAVELAGQAVELASKNSGEQTLSELEITLKELSASAKVSRIEFAKQRNLSILNYLLTGYVAIMLPKVVRTINKKEAAVTARMAGELEAGFNQFGTYFVGILESTDVNGGFEYVEKAEAFLGATSVKTDDKN